MAGRKKEDALSELIGFILLLGLMVMVASLYLTYGVPANGREDEIAHMDYIKQQFLDYKTALDSLWINNAQDVTITQSITLGTQGIKTSGMFGGFGIFKPVFSSGMIFVSQSDPAERMIISARNIPGYTYDYIEIKGWTSTYFPRNNSTMIEEDTEYNLTDIPVHLYLYFNTTRTTELTTPTLYYYSQFPQPYGVSLLNSTKKIEVDLTARPNIITSDYNWSNVNFETPDKNTSYWIRNTTDLVLSISVDDTNILDDYVVYSDIDSGTGNTYQIDLMDPAYGLSQKIDSALDFSLDKFPAGTSTGEFNVQLKNVSKSYINASWPSSINLLPPYESGGSTRYLGRLEYNSNNNYYNTQENFIYQMGGVYVSQTEGSSVLNLPLISINTYPVSYWNVSITDISLNGDTLISGSSPVQVSTQMTNIGDAGLDTAQPNAASVTIRIEDTDQVDLWMSVFRGIVKNAGLSIDNTTVFLSPGSSSSVSLTINGPSSDPQYQDIRLDTTFVDYNVELDPVGQSIGI